ncbi:MAG: hypothetical protein WBM44_06155 [Waterburya sp.]
METIDEVFKAGIKRKALEPFEGRHDSHELNQMIDAEKVKKSALTLITS